MSKISKACQKVNLDEAEEYLLGLLPEFLEIIEKYSNSADLTHTSKGGFDFATEADLELDKFISDSLKIRFPESNFLTEESAPEEYSQLKNAENLWIVDPIDGTINFSRGTIHFAVSIALVDTGKTRLGLAFIPKEGKIYYAREDKSEATLNGEAIKVSQLEDLTRVVASADWSWDVKDRKVIVEKLNKIHDKVRQIKVMGCAVADIGLVAEGAMDVYFHSGLKPWDVAAISLILEKAGGKITTLDGGKWGIFEKSILATNGVLHKKFLGLLK